MEKGVLGIRPEDLTNVPREDSPQIEVRVEVVEILGSDQFLYGKVGDDDVIARVDPQFDVSVGDRVKLTVNMRRLHLFDAESEKALL